MVQNKTQDTSKVKVTRKPRAVKPVSKVAAAPKAAKVAKVTKAAKATKVAKTSKFMPSAGTSFDVIPANRVVPSPSSRPVIAPAMPAQADNTLLATKPARTKVAVKKPAATIDLASNRKMVAAPHDISSGGDVLLEDIAASLSKLQPVPENVVKPDAADGSTQITVKTGRTMAGSSASATQVTSTAPVTPGTPTTPVVSPVSAGPTVGDLLSAQSRTSVATAAASSKNNADVKASATPPSAPPVKQVVGEKRIMPLVGSEKADAVADASGGSDTSDTSNTADNTKPSQVDDRIDVKADDKDEPKKSRPEKPEPRPAGRAVDGMKVNKPAPDDSKPPKDSLDDVLDGLDLSQDKHQTSDSDDPLGLKGTSASNKAETADAPSTGELYGGSSVILIHESHPGRTAFKYFMWFIFVLLLALVALNFLLDAGVVSTSYDIPHTDVLQPMEPSPAEMPQ